MLCALSYKLKHHVSAADFVSIVKLNALTYQSEFWSFAWWMKQRVILKCCNFNQNQITGLSDVSVCYVTPLAVGCKKGTDRISKFLRGSSVFDGYTESLGLQKPHRRFTWHRRWIAEYTSVYNLWSAKRSRSSNCVYQKYHN